MKRLFLSCLLVLALVGPGLAHHTKKSGNNPFAVAIRVNDRVITNYEISQRILLLRAFGTTGDLQKIAEDQLIDERLRLQAATDAGIVASEEEIEEGVGEFAQRGGLNADQLYAYVRSRGADRESMQDFVRAGLLWRNLIQALFGPQSAVTETEIDTALSLQSGRDAQEILISEIRIPIQANNEAAAQELAERLSRELKSEGAFASAARRYSRAPSRGRSGRLDWLPVSNLPPELAGQIMALQPGEVTAPVPLGQTVGLFQLRGVRPAKNQGEVGPASLTYVTVNVPVSNRSEAEAIKLINDVDTCLDLRAKSERFKVSPSFTDHVNEASSLPATLAVELANLDPNESSYYTNSAGGLTVVMLCSRLRDLPEGARENIRNALFQQRISGFGQGYLQELKGDAEIIRTK
ncbi:MAG: peptidylprolyl isomerase [Pseudomonadota bacterium]